MKNKKLLLIAAVGIFSTNTVAAEDTWFVRPYIGMSQMSDLSSDFTDIDSISGTADINLNGGFTAGLGIGYRYNEHLAAEFGWEYRSNDSEVNLANTSTFKDGNYASNVFYINGHYFFVTSGKWQPYVGAGLSWAQEIDIDLERDGVEQSYSGDGESGFQIFAGLNYALSNNWEIQSELRYGSISDINLSGEANDSGGFQSLDYQPTTLQLGLVYNF